MAATPELYPASLLQALQRAQELGFIGEGPLEDHIAHAAGFAEAAIASGHGLPGRILDLGSGGGLPGLVLAHLWPAAAIVLLDSMERRTKLLAQAVAASGLQPRVEVIRERAEVAGRNVRLRGSFELVVARSFGPPPVAAECGAPFLQAGGLLVVSEPPPSPDTGEVTRPKQPERWPDAALEQLGLRPLRRAEDRFGYQLLVQEQPCPARFPRRTGVPAKRPLY